MQRFRLALAALAIGLFGIFGVASPASAADSEEVCLLKVTADPEFAGEDPAHPSAAFEDAVAACFEAPNPLMPELNEVIWGTIGFFTVLIFLWKFGYPAIKKTMATRSERIAEDLAAAEAQKSEAETVLGEYRAQLADARNESARIIEETRQSADQMKRELQAQAEADIAEMRTRAAADIESAKAQAIADLRGEVANLAIGAAEQVVERNLDRDTNVALIESYINQVGANR